MMKGLSKNVENPEHLRFDNSVRPDPATPGPRKLRTLFPHTPVVPKPPQLPYGAKKDKLGRICGFPSFPENIVWGVIFQNVFPPKAAGPTAPSF